MPRPPTPAFAALGALALLGGCATTPAASPVEVTRFHRPEAAQMTNATIRIEPAGDTGQDPAYSAFARALADELRKLGFRPLAADAAPGSALGSRAPQQVAHLSIRHERRQPRREGSRVSVGGGGAVGSYGSGMGLGIGIDLSGPPPAEIVTEIALSIDDAQSGKRLWEGRARQIVSTKSPLAQPGAAAQRMAQALLKNFPGTSGETILVK